MGNTKNIAEEIGKGREIIGCYSGGMSKTDRLQKLLTDENKITIAAVDHRGLLKTMLHPEDPEVTTEKKSESGRSKWSSYIGIRCRDY